MANTPKEIFIAYELVHLDKARLSAANGSQVICLDFLLEHECDKRKIPFVPLRDFVDAETDEEGWWLWSHDISREWYRLPAMDFFQYKGIRLAEVPEPIMQAYLAKLFYYLRIFIFLKKANPGVRFSVPLPQSTNMSAECLMAFQPWTVLDAARMAGLVRPTDYERLTPTTYKFDSLTWKSKLPETYNFLMGLLPRRRHKVYLSGYWTHAESLLPCLTDTEVVLLETKKLRSIPWPQLLVHRICFKYSHNPVSKAKELAARQVGELLVRQWQDSKKQVAQYLTKLRTDLDWGPVLEACGEIVMYAPRIIADIDIMQQVMKTEKPDLVLQMASVGGPHHYFLLMARVAKQLGIPSVELQHATVTSDPRSVFCRIETDYLLTYGKAINACHERLGQPADRLIAVGSPRFDKYVNDHDQGYKIGRREFTRLGLDAGRPVLLVAVPFSETYASAIDSYQLAEFFEVIRTVQKKTPGLQMLFKCRVPKLVEPTREYLKELFSIDWAVTGSEDIFSLICASDAVICNNSTVIYQAVLAKKPLMLYPWKHFDSYHAQIYASHIPLVYTEKEAIETLARIFADPTYKRELLVRQEQFLKDYSFDGKSSQRVAEVIKRLALR